MRFEETEPQFSDDVSQISEEMYSLLRLDSDHVGFAEPAFCCCSSQRTVSAVIFRIKSSVIQFVVLFLLKFVDLQSENISNGARTRCWETYLELNVFNVFFIMLQGNAQTLKVQSLFNLWWKELINKRCILFWESRSLLIKWWEMNSAVFTVFTAVKATLKGLFMHVNFKVAVQTNYRKNYKRFCYIEVFNKPERKSHKK